MSADDAGTISDSGPVRKTRLRPRLADWRAILVEGKDTLSVVIYARNPSG
jgi:hypothetical protein